MASVSRFADWYKAWKLKRERIPDADNVSRWIFHPPMGKDIAELVWQNVFAFPSANAQCESVVWRKYAPDISDVHRMGCERQKQLRAEGKDKTYVGALTAYVRDIRGFRNKNNHGFFVIHEPSEGIYHAHIGFNASPDNEFTKSDQKELKFALIKIFADSSPHTCP